MLALHLSVGTTYSMGGMRHSQYRIFMALMDALVFYWRQRATACIVT